MIFIEIIAGILFVLSSGIFFNERYRRNPLLVCIAGTFAIVSTVLLIASFPAEIAGLKRWALNEGSSSQVTTSTATTPLGECYYGQGRTGPCVDPSILRIVKRRANLRSGPGESYPVVAVVEIGQGIRVTGLVDRSPGWYRVNYRFSEDRVRPSQPLLNARVALFGTAQQVELFVARNMVD
jgi:uncharacterized protein YgiM (DUF1202 family)